MKLRDYQQSAVEYALRWLEYKNTPAIISMATGAGKSHCIAAVAEHYHNLGKRVCILAHRKELLAQNGDKLSIPHGYCSASLGDKDLHLPVIVGGIQTIVRRDLEPFDVIICDECHLMENPDNDEEYNSRYWKFIQRNPSAKLLGFTATPYRLKGGKLSWGDVVYEASYEMLLAAGYLTKLTNKIKHTPDLSKISVVAGDYKLDELSNHMESPDLIDAAIKNIIAYGADRKSVLIFCVSVAHATLLTKAMLANNLHAAVISGDTPQKQRDDIIAQFKQGLIKYLVNCELLIIGFDAPNIDMIVCLRPTMSKGLWEQLLGRSTRVHLSLDEKYKEYLSKRQS